MSRWVLCVGAPSRTASALCTALDTARLRPVLRSDAADALETAYGAAPSAIACELELPDGDGLSFTRWVRAHDALRSTPVVVIGSDPDEDWCLEAYAAGADACVQSSVGPALIAAQIVALVGLADRMGERDAMEGAAGAAIEGSAEQISVPTLLQTLELDRQTGVLHVRSGGREVTLEIVRGHAIGASSAGSTVTPLEAVQAMLDLKAARFAFYRTRLRDIRRSRTDGELEDGVVRISGLVAHALFEADTVARRPAPDRGVLRVSA